MRFLGISHEEIPVNVAELERDPVSWGQVVEMEQAIDGAEVHTAGEVDDVLVMNQIVAAGVLLLRGFLVHIGITIYSWLLSRGRAPLDKLRRQHLETSVAELELESLVKSGEVSNHRIRAADAAVLDGLLELFVLNLVHEWDPSLACLETVQIEFKLRLLECLAFDRNHENGHKCINKGKEKRNLEDSMTM